MGTTEPRSCNPLLSSMQTPHNTYSADSHAQSASSALFVQVQQLQSTSPAQFDPSTKNLNLLLFLVFHIVYFLETN